jgi:hypothetical protein
MGQHKQRNNSIHGVQYTVAEPQVTLEPPGSMREGMLCCTVQSVSTLSTVL